MNPPLASRMEFLRRVYSVQRQNEITGDSSRVGNAGLQDKVPAWESMPVPLDRELVALLRKQALVHSSRPALFLVATAALLVKIQSKARAVGIPLAGWEIGPSACFPVYCDLSDHFSVGDFLRKVAKRIAEGAFLSLPDDGSYAFGVVSKETLLRLGSTNCELLLSWESRTLSVALHYHPRRSMREHAVLQARRVESLLEVLLTNRRTKVVQLICPLPWERELLLENYQCPTKLAPACDTILDHFAATVREAPNQVAAVHGNRVITYNELDAESNGVARLLAHLGVRIGDFVGVLEQRGIDFLVAILGVMKSGAAYVPLDPSYPVERIEHMVEDSRLACLVTRLSHADSISVTAQKRSLQFLFLDVLPNEVRGRFTNAVCDRTDLQSADRSAFTNAVEPSDIAYLIYTSGSSGCPKAAMVRHGGTLNHILAQRAALNLHSATCFLQSAPSSSDISVWQFLAPLLIGGKTVIVDQECVCEPAALVHAIWEQQVTIVEWVPGVFREIVRHLVSHPEDRRKLGSLEWAMITGEPAPVGLVNDWFEIATCPIVNAYGPTEASDDVCQSIVTVPLPSSARSVPIGKPLANVELYVLNPELELTPIESEGELCVSGVAVGAGYYGQPEKTALAFVPNPFAKTIDQSVLYRTGDICRWQADGELDFAGRQDGQVKLRGYRIELGEVESRLEQLPGVLQAVVCLRDETSEERRLVAYVKLSEAGLQRFKYGSQIRADLQPQLPAHMLPGVCVIVDHFPQLANGKIDRQKLGRLPLIQSEEQPCQPLFTTPTQEVLTEIWGEVLSPDKPRSFGVDENFFEAGGHSLLATQVIARIREIFRTDVSIRSFFEAPSIRGLDAIIQKRRSALLESRELRSRPEGASGPLSFAQERLWFLYRLNASSAAYNIVEGVRIHGALDVVLLQRCVNQIVLRHEVLRTRIQSDGGICSQVLTDADALPVTIIELDHLSSPEAEEWLQRAARAEAERPFDLEDWPLLRILVFRLRSEEHVVLINMHHVVGDGWSSIILFQELSALYNAHVRGNTPQLPELPIQYADYAIWQRQNREDGVFELDSAYWARTLAGSPTTSTLSSDHPRPLTPSYRGGQLIFEFGNELDQAIRSFSRHSDVTVFMTLLSAFAVVLGRYAAQKDLLIGTPIAGRARRELESLIGCFVNTLVIRSKQKADDSFRTFVHQIRNQSLEAYDHQGLPFENVVEIVQPERSLSFSPLFQVMFVYQNLPLNPAPMGNLSVVPYTVDSKVAKFDLTLSIWQDAEHFAATVEFAEDLFERETIEGFVRHFQQFLKTAIDHPDLPLSEVSMLTPEETANLICTSAGSVRQTGLTEDTLGRLFEEAANSAADRIAVVEPERSATYRELDGMADVVARFLHGRGIRPETRVGIYGPKRIETIACMIGVLKAGAAFVPLDLAYPGQRLSTMLRNCGASLLLGTNEQKPPPELAEMELVPVEQMLNAESEHPPDVNTSHGPPVDSLNLAYVVYTSGSTGHPKGVMVHHGGVCNLVRAQIATFQLSPEDRILQVASFAFDASVSEIFTTLCAGATLVLLPKQQLLFDRDLGDILDQFKISLLTLPPSLAAVVDEKPLANLRALVLAGESSSPELVRRWGASRRVINAYGPTEASVCASMWIWDGHSVNCPIGRPIENALIYVVDEDWMLTPQGVPGELWVGGVAVSRGYEDRPDWTAERFVPDPWSVIQGQRCYRTGDLARLLPDGNLQFLGRRDSQIKVRGHRVELGEIEALVRRHPAIQEAVALIHESSSRLCCYFTTKQDSQVSQDELATFMKACAPEFMVPHRFWSLAELPLTSNGKVDRAALRRLPLEQHSLPSSDLSNGSPMEQALARLWTEVLKVPNIDLDCDFFQVGGDSILSLQIVARARREGIQLVPKDVFLHPTVRRLAAVAKFVRLDSTKGEQISGEVPLLPIQRWFFAQAGADPSHFNQALLLRLPAGTQIDWLRKSVEALLGNHDALRLSFHQAECGWVGRLMPRESVVPCFFVEDLSSVDELRLNDEIRLRSELHQTSLKLEVAPLFRVVLFDFGAGRDYRLLLIFHHLVVDGVSWRILMEDFMQAYDQCSAGKSVQLTPPTTSVSEWAKYLAESAIDSSLQAQVPYWEAQLRASLDALPRDFVGARGNTIDGVVLVEAALDKEETDTLVRKAPPHYGVRMDELLLAALALALKDWTGRIEHAVMIESHGRNFGDCDLSRTVGWCTAFYPLVLRATSDSPNAVLKETKAVFRNVPTEGVGYLLLQYGATPSLINQGVGVQKEPDIIFNYFGQIDRGVPESDLVSIAREDIGPMQSARGQRFHSLEVTCSIVEDRFYTAIAFSRHLHRPETISRLLDAYMRALREFLLLQVLLEKDYSTNDFPDVQLSDFELQHVLRVAAKSGGIISHDPNR